MVEHVNIPNAHIHEPKGVSTAPSGTVYVSNGLGSGSWQALSLTVTKGSAQGSIVDNVNITDVVAADTNVPINFGSAFVTDNDANTGFTVSNLGVFVNNRDVTMAVLAVANLRLTATTVDPLTYVVSFANEGVLIPGASTKVSVNAGEPANVTLNAGLLLDYAEGLSLRIRAVGHSTDVVVDSVSVSVIGVA